MIQIDSLTFNYSTFHYGQKTPLFDHLDFSLPAGNIYGLLGKNGAGKSTLLKIMSGLLFPKMGSVHVMGFTPAERRPQFLQDVFLVGEEFELPSLSIARYVRLYGPFYPRFDYDLFDSYLHEFQLSKSQQLNSLSFGQKKKFILSFGLATGCRLVILDEPTNGLDIPSKGQFRKVVAGAIHEDRTFIISTHQVRDMENLIDPIIILDEGKVVFFQHCEEVSKKLAFSRQKEVPDPHDLVYSEQSFGGYTVVKKSHGWEETGMNLEMLFKAVVNNKEKIHEIFNPEAI